jgi:hypothetical protein
MAWNAGTIQTLFDREQYNVGRIGMDPLNGMLMAVKQAQQAVDLGNPSVTTILNADENSQTIVTGAGRLYRLRVENLTAAIVFVIVADSVIAQVIGAVKVRARVSATVPSTAIVNFFEDTAGVGETFATSLIVRAFQLDGTGNTGAADGVTVHALTGAA